MARGRFSKQAGVSATRDTTTSTSVTSTQPVTTDVVLNQVGQESGLVETLIRGGNIETVDSEGTVSETSVTDDSETEAFVTLINQEVGEVGENLTFTTLATKTGFLANLARIIINNSTIGAAITILVPSNDAFSELGKDYPNIISALSSGNNNETANKILAYHLILKSGNFLGEKYPSFIPINKVLIPESLLEEISRIGQNTENNGESVETTVEEIIPTSQTQTEVPKWLRQQSQLNNWGLR